MDDLLLRIHRLGFKQPDQAVLGVYGDDPPWVVELVAGYAGALADIPGADIAAQLVAVSHDAATNKRALVRSDIKDLGTFLRDPPPSAVGVILAIKASMAYPLLQDEDGVHTFRDADKTSKCRVHVCDTAPGDYVPPAGVERVGGFHTAPNRRTYNWAHCQVADSQTKRYLSFDPRHLHRFLGQAMQGQLLEKARSLVPDSMAE